MPQINESADYVKDDHFSVDDFKAIATMTSQDFWKFIKDVVPPNQPLATRDKGATPDWTVKLVDGDQQHLLCFQLKSGNDEYSFEQILDELAKCSQMEIANEAYGYSEIVYREAEKHGVKLTFVFGSISHTKVEAQLCLKDYHRLAPSNSFALRITHESWKKVPEHVEIIILRESGMKSTLGLENYEFIANTVLENEVDYSMSDDDQKHLSTEDVKKLIERYASKFSDFNVDVKVTRKVSTSPAHVSVASFPVPPVTNTNTLVKNDAEALEDAASVQGQQHERGVKRPFEDSDGEEDESARKKYKGDTTLPPEKDESK